MGIVSSTSTKWLFFHCFQVELEFENVGFCGGWIIGVLGEKPSEYGREPTTNSTHIWRQSRESNPRPSGGRRMFSPMRHPSSLYVPIEIIFKAPSHSNWLELTNSKQLANCCSHTSKKRNYFKMMSHAKCRNGMQEEL